MIPKQRLGRTDLQATIVGFGGAHISRDTIGDQQAIETVWAALAGGINLIDTAPAYGRRRSEALIGRALRERPDLAEGCILCTKTGRYGGDASDYSYDGTLRSVEESLKRLGVTYLDIVHIHDIWEPERLWEVLRTKAAHAALRQLQAEGIIGHIGLGTRSVATHAAAVESGEFDVLMVANQYNLVEQSGGPVIREALRREIGVLIAGAYASGILARGSSDPAARYWYKIPDPAVREHVASLEGLCQKWGCSLPGAAARFCLRGPAQGAMIALGATGPEQARQNLHVLDDEVPEGFWADVEALLAARAPASSLV